MANTSQDSVIFLRCRVSEVLLDSTLNSLNFLSLTQFTPAPTQLDLRLPISTFTVISMRKTLPVAPEKLKSTC